MFLDHFNEVNWERLHPLLPLKEQGQPLIPYDSLVLCWDQLDLIHFVSCIIILQLLTLLAFQVTIILLLSNYIRVLLLSELTDVCVDDVVELDDLIDEKLITDALPLIRVCLLILGQGKPLLCIL